MDSLVPGLGAAGHEGQEPFVLVALTTHTKLAGLGLGQALVDGEAVGKVCLLLSGRTVELDNLGNLETAAGELGGNSAVDLVGGVEDGGGAAGFFGGGVAGAEAGAEAGAGGGGVGDAAHAWGSRESSRLRGATEGVVGLEPLKAGGALGDTGAGARAHSTDGAPVATATLVSALEATVDRLFFASVSSNDAVALDAVELRRALAADAADWGVLVAERSGELLKADLTVSLLGKGVLGEGHCWCVFVFFVVGCW